MTLLIIGLVLPWVISLGPLAFSGYRLVLLAMTVPCIVMWLSGKVGKVRAADILLVLFCLWSAVSLIVVHGPEGAIEPAGMLFIESFGAYLLARCFIRTPQDFYNAIKLLFVVVVAMLPFALIEALNGSKPILDLARTIAPAIQPTDTGRRMGLFRVQGPFEHSILFGVFCGSILATTFLVLGRNLGLFQRALMVGAVCVTAFLSLSSGPLTALAAQGGLLLWNGLLRNVPSRWRILWGLVIASYFFVDMASNQSVPEFYISKFAFDTQSAWYRILIWDYGSASVLAHPWFGVGLNEWSHPDWMTSSIDMFWLVPAMRYGLPAAILILAAFMCALFSVGFKKGLNEELVAYRTAYLIVMTGFFLVGWTVHFWNATYVLFMFMLGSGMWLLDAGSVATTDRASARRRDIQERRAPLRRAGRVRLRSLSAVEHSE